MPWKFRPNYLYAFDSTSLSGFMNQTLNQEYRKIAGQFNWRNTFYKNVRLHAVLE